MDWPKLLGYNNPTLIVQADDGGLDTAHMLGTQELLVKKRVDSASVFVTPDMPYPKGCDVGLHLVLDPADSYKVATGKMNRQYELFLKFGVPTHMDSHGGTAFNRREVTTAYLDFAHRHNLLPLAWAGLNPYPIADLFEQSGFPLLTSVHLCTGNPSRWFKQLGQLEGLHLLIYHPKKTNPDLRFLRSPGSRPSHYEYTNWIEIRQRLNQPIGGIPPGGAPGGAGGAPPGGAPIGSPPMPPIGSPGGGAGG